MSRIPFIGLAGYLHSPVNSAFTYRQENTNEAYTSAIEKAGGYALLLPYTADSKRLEAAVCAVDGILIPGGLDVDPELYGETAMPCCKEHHMDMDLFQMDLIDMAIRKNRPIFGICRGLQIINVHHGGTLYQDLDECFSKEIKHPRLDSPVAAVHEVRLEDGCILRDVFGKSEIPVNSLHHQGIKSLGGGLSPAAVCTDGLVEGIEDGKNGIFAVQWHPEALMETDGSSLLLFKKLINMTRT